MSTITLPAPALREALAAVMHAVADDEARPILATVRFEPGTTEAPTLRLIAADNYRIAVVPVDEAATIEIKGAPAPWLMVRSAAIGLLRTLKAAGPKAGDVTITDNRPTDPAITFAIDTRASLGYETVFRSILPAGFEGARYPDVESVIKDAGVPGHTITFNAGFLADVAKSLGALGGRLTFESAGPLKPTMIRAYGAGQLVPAFEILMPVRTAESARKAKR